MVAWGDNGAGQIDVPLNQTNVVAISAGWDFNLALGPDGTVTAWGDNSCGITNVPVGLSGVIEVAAGGWFDAALKNDGSVINWGCNNGAPLSGMIAISAGADHGVAIKTDHTVYALWGNIGQGQADVPPSLGQVVAVSAGGMHNLAIQSNGTVVAWGYNNAGQTNVPPGLTNVVAIAGGYIHSLALKSDGTVVAWGDNSAGQTNVPSSLSNVVAIAAGDYHNLALKSDGTIVGWGANDSGQLNVPTGLRGVTAIAAGNAHSVAIVNNNGPLFITKQPFSQSIYNGQNCYFSTMAVGTGLFGYQWKLNGTNIQGATSASLLLTNVQQSDAGTYSVVISDSMSSAASSNANLAVIICPPIITAQPPQDQWAILGTNLNLVVAATGPTPMTYQWQFGGTNLPGATASALGLTNFQVPNEGFYAAVVSNNFYSTNITVHVTAGDLPGALNARNLSWANWNNWFPQTIWTHDGVAAAQSSALGYLHNTSRISTTVDGPGTLSFWWSMRNAWDLDTFAFSADGVQQAIMYASSYSNPMPWTQVNTYLPAGSLSLSWVFSGGSGVNYSVKSANLDQVTYVPGPTLPIVQVAPVDQSVPATGTATFTVSATGTPPITYQWQFNGTNLAGTRTALSIAGVQATNAGVYTALAMNPYGTNSTSAALTVIPVPPQIVIQPSNQRTPLNGNATFNVSVTGSVPFSYQWLLNGNPIAGASNSTLALTDVQFTNAGNYRVVISNGAGVTNSAGAVLTVAWLIAWGDNSWGQTAIPPTLTNAAAIAAGLTHSVSLGFDGTVAAWGSTYYYVTPAPAGLSNVVGISAGEYHNLALRSDGTVVGWGAGTSYANYPNYGQATIPTWLSNVVAIAAGGYHSLALKDNGTVVAWGYNMFGQTNVPASATNIVALAAGGYHSLALRADGVIIGWGAGTNNNKFDSNYGQLQPPAGLTNVAAIAAGSFHTLALTLDRTVLAWGDNTYGQTNVPSGLTNVVAIAAGGYHNMALRADGNIVAWGNNSSGQRNVPVGVSNVVTVAGGINHSLAIMNDGTPVILRQTSSRTVNAGGNIIFVVVPVGAPVVYFQWRMNGTNIAGATSASLTLTNIALSAAASYSCLVSNALGTVVSSPMVLNVLRAIPTFTRPSLTSTGLALTLNGLSGHGPVLVFASTNLVDWTPRMTNPPILGTLELFDSTTTNSPLQFYRALER